MRFVFQPSYIWEAGDPPDPKQKKVKIRATSEERARKKISRKPIELGRKWVLVDVI